jgi:CrcB protein
MLNQILLAGAGGFVGAATRFALGHWITARTVPRTDFPFATFSINVTGCLIIGILWAIHMHHVSVPKHWQILIFTGVLGGFTTFSTFGWETLTLIQSGNLRNAAIYALGSMIFGLVAVWIGYTATAALAKGDA